MSDVEKRYIWLVKHLIWNGSKQTDATYWIKISKEDAEELSKKYEVVDTRTLKGSTIVSVIRMLDNFIVLDTR